MVLSPTFLTSNNTRPRCDAKGGREVGQVTHHGLFQPLHLVLESGRIGLGLDFSDVTQARTLLPYAHAPGFQPRCRAYAWADVVWRPKKVPRYGGGWYASRC